MLISEYCPESRGGLRGLVFDMGDVLFDATQWRRWLAMELDGAGVPITYDTLVERWEAQLAAVYRGHAEYWTTFRRFLTQLGIAELESRALEVRAREMAETVSRDRSVFPGVAETLAVLKASGVHTAVLSDSESTGDALRLMLNGLGIGNDFDAIITSRDIGAEKPDERAYVAAATALGLSTHECGFVGHEFIELNGAAMAGMLSIAFNTDPSVGAHLWIERFAELPIVFSTFSAPRRDESVVIDPTGDAVRRQRA